MNPFLELEKSDGSITTNNNDNINEAKLFNEIIVPFKVKSYIFKSATESQLKAQTICNNVRIDNKTILYNSWYKNGVVFVNDVVTY